MTAQPAIRPASAGNAFSGGFDAPVFDAQTAFRAIMAAFARPGTVIDFTAAATPPAPFGAEAATLALALLDHETPVWCDQTLADNRSVIEWLRFHTNAPFVEAASDAAFAFVSAPARLPSLSSFAQGSADYPDRSTTLVIAVETFRGHDYVDLTGPGIKTTARFAPAPLPPSFWTQAQANHALFPRGIDMVFAGARKLAALPRSTTIKQPGM